MDDRVYYKQANAHAQAWVYQRVIYFITRFNRQKYALRVLTNARSRELIAQLSLTVTRFRLNTGIKTIIVLNLLIK